MKTATFLKGAVLAAALPMLIGAASAENVLRWTSQGDALTLDPQSQNEGPTTAMNQNIYESLVKRDWNLVLEPGLAESWTPLDDGNWEFKLRQGVKFHDGADFTAEDVVFTFNRANAASSDFKEYLKTITEVKAVDDYTVHIITDNPNPILPNELTSIFIVDKGWAERNRVVEPQDYAAKQETFAVRNANGTGPFIVEQRLPDELTVLVKNPDWWGLEDQPHNIDKIEYRPIKNAATRVAALLSGEVDFVLDPPLQDLKRIEAADGLGVKTVNQIRTIFFGMDQGIDELRSSNIKGKNPFADKRVRQAMYQALDVEAIRRVVMEGQSFPAGIITSPGVLGFTEELDERLPFDVEGAKQLMADAGYADGFSVQLDCPNNRYNNDENICQAAVAMLAKIGIDVKLEAIPKSEHFPKLQNRVTDFYMLGWGVPTLDSAYVFDFLYDSEGSWNVTGFSNARLDELAETMASETDLDKRAAMIAEAWAIAKDDIAYLPIHHQVIAWGMSDKLDMPIVANDSPHFRWARMN
ncbi:MAG: ABC transporter substrate-binding protein [Alphaproteobacteria bacterium]|nr:ABC transporter substrate-binding protein [Alphaproteobacteria bacterium]